MMPHLQKVPCGELLPTTSWEPINIARECKLSDRNWVKMSNIFTNFEYQWSCFLGRIFP